MNDILINVIGAIVTLVLIPLIGFGGKALVNLINEKVKNEKLKKCLTTATEIVGKSVDTIAQTYVNELKAAGSFTPDSQQAAFGKALENAKALISDEAKQIIQTVHSDFDKWLATLIEAHIHNTKIK